MSEFNRVIVNMPKHPNVYVDTTFQHPERMKQLVNAFGSERVLFGSDWPYGDMDLAVDLAKQAFQNESDKKVYARVMRENAKNLLHLEG